MLVEFDAPESGTSGKACCIHRLCMGPVETERHTIIEIRYMWQISGLTKNNMRYMWHLPPPNHT